jgi:hypothetical protein
MFKTIGYTIIGSFGLLLFGIMLVFMFIVVFPLDIGRRMLGRSL